MMYTNRRHDLSTSQMAAQLAQLEEIKAHRRAALAIDCNPDYPSFVRNEMKCRAIDAMAIIDAFAADEDHADLLDTQAGAIF